MEIEPRGPKRPSDSSPIDQGRNKRVGRVKKWAARRRDTEEALRLAQRELAQKNKALKMVNQELLQYASISSHDLKGPLRAIRNYSDFLCEDFEKILSEEHRACLNGLERAVRQGEELVDDLIEFSRVGLWYASAQPVDLAVLLKEITAAFNVPADTEIAMERHWPTIEGDPTLLKQIFEELIDNAIKFNHTKTRRVEIGWEPRGEDDCELFVRDNGIGIEPRHQQQVFNMFQRLHSRLDYTGTGMGLAIVRKAAFKLHGSVRVESEPGEGSTFFVLLPRTQSKAHKKAFL